MAISEEVRKLEKKWDTRQGWPKRLEWLQITGLRGWTGQRVDFHHPLVAIVGENGSGKSTILQAAASIYRSTKRNYASKFFLDTPWDKIEQAEIRASIREGDNQNETKVSKLTLRWRGNPERRLRDVHYVDLRRLQPIVSQTGYLRIAKGTVKEKDRKDFDGERLNRLSSIVGRNYTGAGFSLSDVDNKRWVPVVNQGGAQYSGFHQGAGETTLVDLLRSDIPKYSLLLIDELETSLHPRSQRRLIRDLAKLCRVLELQVIVTTHSPYILEELPAGARVCVMNTSAGRTIVPGVSPYFAMTQMDDERHPDATVFVEDDHSRVLVEEIMFRHRRDLAPRCDIIPFGAASVGKHLGIMVSEARFKRPTVVFLDGDQDPSSGCVILPGGDAPERVVFRDLLGLDWPQTIAQKISRSHSVFVDAAKYAMTLPNHHEWVRIVADRLVVGGNTLWRSMCATWADQALTQLEGARVVEAIESSLRE